MNATPLRHFLAASGRRPGAASVVLAVATVASAFVALFAHSVWSVVADQPLTVLAFVAVTLLFQLPAVPVFGRGSISVAGVALLAAGFTVGVGGVVVVATAAAICLAVRNC